MKSKTFLLTFTIAAIAIAGILFWKSGSAQSPSGTSAGPSELTVAISPYQDIAMLVNAEPLGLVTKYGTRLQLITMAWEDILPAVGSAGQTVDVGFGSLVEYLTKYAKLNDGSTDPVLYVQPLYVYKGGGFVTFDPKITTVDAAALKNSGAVKAFLQYRIGAQKQSLYEMMIFSLARRSDVPTSSLKIYDTPMNDGLLALQSGSLDVSSAGLTQLNEARKRGGRMVLSMEDSGFADVTGFICRKSILEAKRVAIENLTRIWFDSVNYVMTDPRSNSKHSLDYLRKNAATQYTYKEYTAALGQEYLPRSPAELQTGMLASGSKYEFARLAGEITDYLIENKVITNRPPVPTPLITGH